MSKLFIASPHIFTDLFPLRTTLASVTAVFLQEAPGTQDFTCPAETKCRHALKKLEKNINVVQALEVRLCIVDRWKIGGLECEETAKLVSMHKYQHTLDTLKGLVVAWIFELSKMNRPQTG